MNVLVTGHDGYIGTVMVPLLRSAGHHVVGLDSYLFDGCAFGPQADGPAHALRMDVRDVRAEELSGFDAVIHLAAISNDPLGSLNPASTFEINHAASARLARLAKQAGVRRFLFASSCSLYGKAGDEMLTETAEFNPITPYGESKVRVEHEVAQLADERFSPVFLRNATAYGASPRLRTDVVVNNLAATAYTTGEIVMHSDGTPWRPLVHVEDIGLAFLAALEAPRDAIHNQAFNVGRTDENYQVRELAEMVHAEIPTSRVSCAPGAGPDPRCYRVDCSKIAAMIPGFRPRWTVREGIRDLVDRFRVALTRDMVLQNRFVRLAQIQRLRSAGRLTTGLRWTESLAGRREVAVAALHGDRAI